VTVQVKDDVWRRLDPTGGQLPTRSRRRIVVTVIVLALLTGAATAVESSGVIVPHISADGGWDGAWVHGDEADPLVDRRHDQVTTHVSQTLQITNDSGYPLSIIGVDRDQPGMRVERVALGDVHFDAGRHTWRTGGATLVDGYQLAPHEDVQVTLFYDITDCAAITAEVQTIPVRVRRWFGTQTVPISPLPLRPYRTGGWMVSTADDPEAVQWQRFLADHVCEIPYPNGMD
jgi:hypothetical protein